MRSALPRRRFQGPMAILLGLSWWCIAAPLSAIEPNKVHDLSLLVSPRLPCVWPVGMQQHFVVPSRTFGPGAYHRDMVVIDEHTGTQFDAPAHFVPPPDSGLPGAGPTGTITGEKVPVWQFVGEACVIDVTDHVDDAAKGASYLIGPEVVQAWEKKYRPLGYGDVVLFRSDYSDRYYRPLSNGGERFAETVLRGSTPGWPAPTPQCMEYLASRGVMTLGLDSPSMGPVPDLAAATHQAGGRRGMVWMECGTNLGTLPATGAAFVLLPAKHAGGSGNESRAMGITDAAIARRMIESARAKRVVDLSIVMDDELPVTWPGYGAGDEATRYLGKTLNAFGPARGPYFARSHTLDSSAGTHVVTPSFSLPPEGFDRARYADHVQKALANFEQKFGPLSSSTMSTEQLPLAVLQGEAHVIDVSSLLDSTSASDWPSSPEISLELIKAHELQRPFQAGEVVIFASGYSDRHFAPLPAQPALDRVLAAPLAGKAEGWPAPTPEAIAYLAERGINCIATDGPTMGGVDPTQALTVYWMAASKGVFLVEYLTGAAGLPQQAYFIFAPIKIEGTHAGYGRAIATY